MSRANAVSLESTLTDNIGIDPLVKLGRDLKKAGATLEVVDARYLVDMYYSMQQQRIRTANQERAALKGMEPEPLDEEAADEVMGVAHGFVPVAEDPDTCADCGAERSDPAHAAQPEPHEVIKWLRENTWRLERNIAAVLDTYSLSKRTGRWARSQVGIGPVLAAGLLAHIDPKKAITAGKVWRFAGLDPTVRWEKGQKRPWNARLKVLCWKIGESFKKQSTRPGCVYGVIYRARKLQEVERNNAGMFAEQAAATLAAKKFRDNATKARYQEGRLPDGRLDLRATRYAVKLFLSHYQAVAYEVEHGTKPPKPWVIEHGGHSDYIAVPGWPCP